MFVQITETFDTYAETYEEKFNHNPMGRYQRERVHREILPYLKPGGEILDVGCGPGSDFDFFKSHNLRVDAIDASEKMAAIAREKAKHLNLDAQVLHVSLREFSTGHTYPAILLNFGVINALPNLPEAIDKLHQLLQDDGVLIVVSMPPFHLFSAVEMLVKLQLRTAFNRFFKKRVALSGGIQVQYYNRKYFRGQFNITRRINLCAVLPTPDQYVRWRWIQGVADRMMALDSKAGDWLPDVFGGDHILYILRKKI